MLLGPVVTEVSNEAAIKVHVVQPWQAVSITLRLDEDRDGGVAIPPDAASNAGDRIDSGALTQVRSIGSVGNYPKIPKTVPSRLRFVLAGLPKLFLDVQPSGRLHVGSIACSSRMDNGVSTLGKHSERFPPDRLLTDIVSRLVLTTQHQPHRQLFTRHM
jgi:hypothetical protein